VEDMQKLLIYGQLHWWMNGC